MRNILAIVVVALLTSCATTGKIPVAPVAGDNILLASPGEKWQLAESNESGEVIRTLRIALTNHPSDTCIAGDWKEVKIISDPTHYTRKPAYLLADGHLEILLVNGLCDAYDSYIFDKNIGLGSGSHQAYGMFGGKLLGHVVASKVR